MGTTTETLSMPLEQHSDFGNAENVKSPAMRVARVDSEVVPPPSTWTHLCHRRIKEVQDEVDRYFLENWKFPNSRAVKTFLDAKFSEVTCLYFALALEDKIHFVCWLLTFLFLIDGSFQTYWSLTVVIGL